MSHVNTPIAKRMVSMVGLIVQLLLSNNRSSNAKIPNPILSIAHPNVAHFRPPKISNIIPLSRNKNVTNMESEFIVLAIRSHWAGQHSSSLLLSNATLLLLLLSWSS